MVSYLGIVINKRLELESPLLFWILSSLCGEIDITINIVKACADQWGKNGNSPIKLAY